MKRADIKRRPMADSTLAALESESKTYREHDGQPTGIYNQVDLAGGACSAFPYCFVLATGSIGTVRVGLSIAAINENPFHVRFSHPRLKDLEPLT